jgi:hypothetical protein
LIRIIKIDELLKIWCSFGLLCYHPTDNEISNIEDNENDDDNSTDPAYDSINQKGGSDHNNCDDIFKKEF